MSAELKRLADVLKFANDHRNDIEEEKYPSYEEMQKALENGIKIVGYNAQKKAEMNNLGRYL